MATVDIVVVSYNSARTLRPCVGPLAGDQAFAVIVVDNASRDHSLDAVADLPVETIPLGANFGFAYGCNRGWLSGSSPFVLFLNPDARIDGQSLRRLVQVLKDDDGIGAVGPRILEADGSLELSQRRFPRLCSAYSQALFLHRLFPRAGWADEVVHDPRLYERPRETDWISGACILVRREALERLHGWDEAFFLYGEDVDLCRRLWTHGYRVRYEPGATANHVGGASAPRAGLLPLLAQGRLRFASKHLTPGSRRLFRAGVALGELTHALLTTRGNAARRGHLRAFASVLSGKALTKRPGTSVPTAVEPRTPNK